MTHNIFCPLVANILDNGAGAEVAFLGATTIVWFTTYIFPRTNQRQLTGIKVSVKKKRVNQDLLRIQIWSLPAKIYQDIKKSIYWILQAPLLAQVGLSWSCPSCKSLTHFILSRQNYFTPSSPEKNLLPTLSVCHNTTHKTIEIGLQKQQGIPYTSADVDSLA